MTTPQPEQPAAGDLPVVDWTSDHAAALREALGPRAGEEDGPFGYCELAGFLFALACAPELVQPAEWLPVVLGEEFKPPTEEEAQALFDLLMRLYNHVNRQVLEGAPALPAGVEARTEPMHNFEADAPLSQWAQGFLLGDHWLAEVWDACIEEESREEAEDLEESLGATALVLGFFSSREFAQAWIEEMESRSTLEEAAPGMLEGIPEAMEELAVLGRSLYEAHLERHTPARSTKVGRNAPCPCGSGRKYKHCCGAAARGS